MGFEILVHFAALAAYKSAAGAHIGVVTFHRGLHNGPKVAHLFPGDIRADILIPGIVPLNGLPGGQLHFFTKLLKLDKRSEHSLSPFISPSHGDS